jgi:hypothetical protein
VLRVRRAPDDERLEALNEVFGDIVVKGRIERIGPTKVELADEDFPELDRVTFRFDRRNWARLRGLIDALNHPYRAAKAG